MNLTRVRKATACTTLVLIIGFIVVPAITHPVASEENGGRGWVYVDDDADSGWYDETHVRTIQEGVDNASEDDTVFVYNGFYQENLEVNKRLALVGEDRNHTIIDGGGNGDVVLIHIADWTTVTGFTIQHSRLDAGYAGVLIGSNHYRVSHITVSGNNIFDNDIGIINRGGCYENIIRDNNVHHNNGIGIILDQGSGSIQVIDNNIGYNGANDSSTDSGISMGVTDDNIVKQNDIYNNRGHGMYLYDDDNSQIFDNLIRDNERCGIRAIYSHDTVIHHNDFFYNSPNGYDSLGTSGVKWYDYHWAIDGLGNYWEDWDGSGPYDIPGEGGNQDPYPLTRPYGWASVSPYDSYMTLSPGGLTTCPAGDENGWGAAYSLPIVTVTVNNFLGNPKPNIQAEEFSFSLSPASGTRYYNTLSCTFTPLDNKTDGNGEIQFEIQGDTSIQGNITITAFVRDRELDDTDMLWCNSYDRWLSETLPQDGHVGLQDFAKFAWDWNTARWGSDFNWNGQVDIVDLGMFSAHWGHDH